MACFSGIADLQKYAVKQLLRDEALLLPPIQDINFALARATRERSESLPAPDMPSELRQLEMPRADPVAEPEPRRLRMCAARSVDVTVLSRVTALDVQGIEEFGKSDGGVADEMPNAQPLQRRPRLQ